LGILGLASLQELAAHSAASLSHSKVATALQKKKIAITHHQKYHLTENMF